MQKNAVCVKDGKVAYIDSYSEEFEFDFENEGSFFSKSRASTPNEQSSPSFHSTISAKRLSADQATEVDNVDLRGMIEQIDQHKGPYTKDNFVPVEKISCSPSGNFYVVRDVHTEKHYTMKVICKKIA